MTILSFGGPSSIVKTRLPSQFARSGHIWSRGFIREAWCVERDACSPKSLKRERATPHARHAWCVFVLGSRIHRSGSGQHASREPTMTSCYGFSRVTPPPPPRSSHVIEGQRADPFVDYTRSSFLICALFWRHLHVMIRIYGEAGQSVRNTQHYYYKTSLKEYKDSIRDENI